MMKKLILCASTLLVSLGLANAQTPGVTSTSGYDDFQGTGYVTADAIGINWFGGTRSTGKYAATVASGTAAYIGVDFGTNTVPNPDVKLGLNLTTMADVLVDFENTSTTQAVSVRFVMEDVTGKQTQIEPNISDVALVSTETATLENYGVTWPNGDQVYPKPAYNGFVLPKNTRRTVRLDLSSVAGNFGGRKAGAYTAGNPNTMPASSYDFDITQVHAVLFIINEGTDFTFSNGAVDKGSYKYDTSNVGGQSNFAGTVNFYSFKIGDVLSALAADPNPPTLGVDAVTVNNSLKVYPNPAKDVLNVSFDGNQVSTMTLSDLSGHTVYTTSTSVGQNNISVNTSGFQAGMYILNIESENGKVVRKVSVR